MTYKILITDNLSPQGLDLIEAADDVEFDVVTGLTTEALTKKIVGYDGLIVRSSVTVTEAVLKAADKLKVVGRAGVGVDNIDVNTASLLGIIVMNTPEANTVATTEHTVALLLALCRHIPQAHATLRAGKWDRKQFKGVELCGKTLGVIGMGRIGSRVATRCQSFGMDVITHDPYLSDDMAHRLKVKRVTLSELFANADFITLHAALTPNTQGLINRETIAQMKQGVRIVNAARGALIDEEALTEGLESGKIAGVALDVFTEEPPNPDHPLLGFDNVVVTPHLAASTEEAQRDVSTQVVEQMLDALRDVEYRHAINLPIADVELLHLLRPYLDLAEKVGSFQTQLAEDAIQKIEIEVKGDPINHQVKPITVALLKGILEPVLHHAVNYVNAPYLAQERGITISQTSSLHTPDYPNLISCRVEWAGGSRTVSATLFNKDEPRFVQVDGYRVDVHPEGIILMTHSYDRPGFIGRVGNVLGELGINIATWRTGRAEPGGLAVSFITVDHDVPERVLRLLDEFELIQKIQKVHLL
ncbi:MAG: phosphoglycerate dehydrogenase [Chloroflexota bacterium]